MLKRVSAGGRVALGKKYSGRRFEVEERVGGELILRPVLPVCDKVVVGRAQPAREPTYQIADVEQIVMPAREQRNVRSSPGAACC